MSTRSACSSPRNCGRGSDRRCGNCREAFFAISWSIQASIPISTTSCASSSVAPNVAWFRNWKASVTVTGGGAGGGGGGAPVPPDDPPQADKVNRNTAAAVISLCLFMSVPVPGIHAHCKDWRYSICSSVNKFRNLISSVTCRFLTSFSASSALSTPARIFSSSTGRSSRSASTC